MGLNCIIEDPTLANGSAIFCGTEEVSYHGIMGPLREPRAKELLNHQQFQDLIQELRAAAG